MQHPTLDWRTCALLTVPPLLWAANAVTGRLLVGLFPPIALNYVRWISALVVLAPFVIAARRRRGTWPRAPWRTMLAVGTLGVGMYNSLQYLALQTSTPVNITLIAASAPAWTLAVGALIFHERTATRQWIGAAVSICGVLLVMIRGDFSRLSTLNLAQGDLYMLVATVSWSFYTWMLRRHRPDLALLDFLALQIVCGLLVLTPVVGLETILTQTTIHWSPALAAALCFLAIGPSIVAYACWDQGVRRAGASIPIFFTNLTPLFAAVFSAALLGETPRAFHAAAFVLILAGIALAFPPRRL